MTISKERPRRHHLRSLWARHRHHNKTDWPAEAEAPNPLPPVPAFQLARPLLSRSSTTKTLFTGRSSSIPSQSTMKDTARITFSRPGTEPPVFVVTAISNPPWQPVPMDVAENLTATGDLLFVKELDGVDVGDHQYKIRRGDSDWVVDKAAATAVDELGNKNNVVTVHPPEPADLAQATDGEAAMPPASPHSTLQQHTAEQPPLVAQDGHPASPETLARARSTSSAHVSNGHAQDAETKKQNVPPKLVVSKTDAAPAHGDDFGGEATVNQRIAHEMRRADAPPDEVVIVADEPLASSLDGYASLPENSSESSHSSRSHSSGDVERLSESEMGPDPASRRPIPDAAEHVNLPPLFPFQGIERHIPGTEESLPLQRTTVKEEAPSGSLTQAKCQEHDSLRGHGSTSSQAPLSANDVPASSLSHENPGPIPDEAASQAEMRVEPNDEAGHAPLDADMETPLMPYERRIFTPNDVASDDDDSSSDTATWLSGKPAHCMTTVQACKGFDGDPEPRGYPTAQRELFTRIKYILSQVPEDQWPVLDPLKRERPRTREHFSWRLANRLLTDRRSFRNLNSLSNFRIPPPRLGPLLEWAMEDLPPDENGIPSTSRCKSWPSSAKSQHIQELKANRFACGHVDGQQESEGLAAHDSGSLRTDRLAELLAALDDAGQDARLAVHEGVARQAAAQEPVGPDPLHERAVRRSSTPASPREPKSRGPLL